MGLLRFTLALAVLLTHAGGVFGYTIVDSDVAVQSFYVISGFLITFILNEKYVGEGASWLFYTNRFLRLFPTYWVILAGSVLAALALYVLQHRGVVAAYAASFHANSWPVMAALLVTNVMLVGQDWAMLFDYANGIRLLNSLSSARTGGNSFLFVPQAWSLGVEISFYVLAPAVVRRPLIAVLILAFSLVMRIFGYFHGYIDDPWSYRFFPFELSMFLMGTLSYYLWGIVRKLPKSSAVFWLSFLPLIAAILYPAYKTGGIGFFTPSKVFYFLLLTVSLPAVFEKTKACELDRLIGDLSYPLYLCHVLVLWVLHQVPVFRKEGPVYALCGAIASIAVAWMITYWLDERIDAFRQTRLRLAKPNLPPDVDSNRPSDDIVSTPT